MYYSYQDFLKDLKELRNRVQHKIGIPDALVCIARGGMTMSHMLGLAWNIRAVYTLNAISYSDTNVQSSLIIENMPSIKKEHKKILILDEIVDSGESLSAVAQKLRLNFPEADFKTAVIFQKPGAKVHADFSLREPTEWVNFFWEVDMLEDPA
ncbi:phosphoribosyltransferase [Helicobacter mustelae]|uniref:Putative nucleotide phosphoribosyltransferase n=1 Tax=Helicobacter mustelae (strain ATCC 43772 / CCUG 25715 / CIP 103759 / LMG 18044 / NCTC 12198 / R85-136P) TaxID=679897 RepID=D3UIS4_HELM1|nr:phosphoribosyltransferase family protein [Helicobacter mustelae]CBG40399.1 putative nucleotide phosphoribosyltransferase [Helicobacter mustelae 12198]SQH71899.1 nucleotide phosphoribosyltransferase [Helicobacter mustelae]STP13039.1 nucleotide phosphoribosyltransferase [Helicobacter mustelae]